ncbi:MAG TPA: hypothetical protein VHF06_32115, partial [Pseudonocardiaceae bacterium]|nr:hypothetical protein [Pseudonocardiaceae bacterium]
PYGQVPGGPPSYGQPPMPPGQPGPAMQPGQPMPPSMGMPVPQVPAAGYAPGAAAPGVPVPGMPFPGAPAPGMPVPGWPGQPVAPVGPGVIVGVSLWRLVIVAFAITGFSLAMSQAEDSSALAALSQQASLLTAICYVVLLLFPAFTGGRKHEPDTPWLRGALVVLLGLVSVTFLTMLDGGLSEPWSLFEHLLTPLIVLADWLFVGRDQRNARWWFPFTWLAFPVAYLLFYIAYGEVLYPFLDPHDGDFGGVVCGFLAGVVAFGFVVYGIGKLKGMTRPPVG